MSASEVTSVHHTKERNADSNWHTAAAMAAKTRPLGLSYHRSKRLSAIGERMTNGKHWSDEAEQMQQVFETKLKWW